MRGLFLMKKISSFVMLSCLISNLIFFYSYATPITDMNEVLIQKNENEVTKIVRNHHPRQDNLWIQYYPLTTALRKNIVISDVISPDATWENYSGIQIDRHRSEIETPENYDDSHNHYQNILSEVLNFQENSNAVSIWGDSYAVADQSKAWGGFFSARSGVTPFLPGAAFETYVPENAEIKNEPEKYDTQLTGIEIEVLNGGLPGVYPNMSKTGLQIVGFGNPNSMAIEVRCEDTDKEGVSPDERKGVWESGIYFKNSLAPYGRVLVTDFEKAKIGLDFRNTLFSEGTISFKTQQVGTGILLNDGNSGEIYGGQRWNEGEDLNDWLTLRAGNGGIRIVSQDNTRELVAIDNFGGIYLNGDIYLNGKKLPDYSLKLFSPIIVLLALLAFLTYKVIKLSMLIKKVSFQN